MQYNNNITISQLIINDEFIISMIMSGHQFPTGDLGARSSDDGKNHVTTPFHKEAQLPVKQEYQPLQEESADLT